jgi:hypothetical protein
MELRTACSTGTAAIFAAMLLTACASTSSNPPRAALSIGDSIDSLDVETYKWTTASSDSWAVAFPKTMNGSFKVIYVDDQAVHLISTEKPSSGEWVIARRAILSFRKLPREVGLDLR